MSQKTKRKRKKSTSSPSDLLSRERSRVAGSLRADVGESIHLASASVDLEAVNHTDLQAEVDDAKVKKFSLSPAYSGGLLYVSGFQYPVVVDLSGVIIKAAGGNVNVTLDHKGENRVGHTTNLEVRQDGIYAEGLTSAATDSRDEVLQSAADGFGWQASIEGRVVNKTLVKAGNSVRVNGRLFRGPVFVARKFVLSAISFVSSGGDEENNVRLAAQLGESDMKFNEWLKAKGFDPDNLTEESKTYLRAQFDAEQTASSDSSADSPADPPAAREQEPLAAHDDNDIPDRDYAAEYREKVAQEEDRIERVRAAAKDHPNIRSKAIRENWSPERTELEVLRAEREQTNIAFHCEEPGGGPDREQVLLASLCQNHGVGLDNLDFSDDVRHEASRRENRDLTLHRLMYDVIRAANIPYRPGSGTDSFIRAAVQADETLRAAGAGFSTITLSGTLSNYANKALLAAYNAVPVIATQVCGTRDVNDFKLHRSYRVTTKHLLHELGPDGEIKHTEMTESEYTNQLKTYARMLALTRHDMINDDLNALTRIAAGFGRVAAKTLDHAFHTELLANTGSFFASGNSNYASGAATALSITSLTTAAQMFLRFTDDAGHPMMVDPGILLVPPTLDVTSKQLYNDVFVNETTTENAPKPSNNPHVGKYRPVTSPWLELSTITGYSDDAWYLIADPADVAFMEIAYLRGQRAPTIESSDSVFNTLGMQWRAYLDFGIAFQDTSGAVKMKGEA